MRKDLFASLAFALTAIALSAPSVGAGTPSKHRGSHPPAEPKPYASFVKGANITPGLIPIIHKAGKVYLALSPGQFGKDFIETSVPSSGLGGLGPAPGTPYVAPARILHFERAGNSVVLRWPNRYTLTRPDSPQSVGVRSSLPDSVIAVVPIAAEDGSHDGLIRRNVQTSYARLLSQMWTAPAKGTPADTQALARLGLRNLVHAATVGAPRAADELERAHLEALAALARQALRARVMAAAPLGAAGKPSAAGW